MGHVLEKVLSITRFVKWTILACWTTFDAPFKYNPTPFTARLAAC